VSEPLKVLYLLWDGPEGREATRDLLLGRIGPALLALEPQRLVVYVEDPESDLPSPNPFTGGLPLPFAEVDLWLDDIGDRARFEQVLAAGGVRFHAWQVEESVYTDYGGNRHARARDWPDGHRSPGVVMLTLLTRPGGMARDEWVRRWHGRISPVSEGIQPRTRYVRNLVVAPLTEDAPPWEGMVAECWPSARHIRNPFLFYGAGRNPLKVVWNMGRIVAAVAHFTSIRKVRSIMTGEYFLKTDGGR